MGKYDLFYKGRERWTGKCKEKVINHRNNEFAEFLLKPIVDIEYYLPEFKEFDIKQLFINGDTQNRVLINLNVPSLFKRIKTKVHHEDTDTGKDRDRDNNTSNSCKTYLYSFYKNKILSHINANNVTSSDCNMKQLDYVTK